MEDSVIPVLDHGFVQLDGVFGSDADIARIARVSTGKGNKTPEEDQRFLDYLWRHQHLSPFGFPQMRFRIKMPIFVARQWMRHRTAQVNEVSARYTELVGKAFLPEASDFGKRETHSVKTQTPPLEDEVATFLASSARGAIDTSLTNYHIAVSMGAPKEVARVVIPVAAYTEVYWQQDLRNLLHLLQLRLDPHAQQEIRAYAEAVAHFVQAYFPWTWEVFDRHTLRGRHLDADELALLRSLIDPDALTAAVEGSTLRATRRRELLHKLNEGEDS